MTEIETENGPRLINVKEAAALCGCNWRTLLRWCDAGLAPPGLRVGGLRRWNREVVEEWIQQGCPRVRR